MSVKYKTLRLFPDNNDMASVANRGETLQRIVVIGAKEVGKTSILSHALTGDFDSEYFPTTRREVYYDVRRSLELVDTPGIDDNVFGDKPNDKLTTKKAMKTAQDAFREDLAVEALLEESELSKQEVAYLIVWSDRRPSWSDKQTSGCPNHDMAKALCYLLRDRDVQVFVVRNVRTAVDALAGDENFGKLDKEAKFTEYQSITFEEEADPVTPELAQLRATFDSKKLPGDIIAHEFNKKLPGDIIAHEFKEETDRIVDLGQVCAETGAGLVKMLDTMARHLKSRALLRPRARPAKIERKMCSGAVLDCTIS
eukprot:g72573.t1